MRPTGRAGDDHIRAFFGKRQDSGFADARVTSSNKDSLVSKLFMVGLNVSNAEYSAK